MSGERRGSALLVVLGMLSFMLISAVAFSAYMRYARLPSSYLRRSSASRMLVKAALAEAIDEIDAAIGNNPHPGVGTQSPRQGAGSLNVAVNESLNEDLRTRNHWRNHVYIGSNELYQTDQTVSTLTLEGLAYIPPPYVNEARYFSRRSIGGIWKNLGFDAGRYAFCAIDVSDCFDVNVLSAKIPRNSAPSGKISLAHLFESGEEHTAGGADVLAWDKFLVDANVRTMSVAESDIRNQDPPPADAAHVPFVSVADYNLALNDKKPLGWESPFCRYVESGGGDFYSGVGVTDATGETADKVKRQTFVTDSLFPPTASSVETPATGEKRLIDLSDFNEQPFEPDGIEMLSATYPIDRFIDPPAREAGQRLANKLSIFGYMALYDYLDANNVPLSLALPSVERAPMIAGIGNENMNANLTVSSDQKEEPFATEGKTRMNRRTTTYKIDGAALAAFIDSGTYKAVLAYPFRRGVDVLDPIPAFKFTLEGQLSVFFARKGEIGFRSGGGALSASKDLFAPGGGKMENGVLRIPITFDVTPQFDNVDSEANAVKHFDAILSKASSAKSALMDYLDKNPLLTVVEEWKQTNLSTDGGEVWDPLEPPDGSEKKADSMLGVVKKDGSTGLLDSFLGGRSEELVLCSAVWLRVKNGNDMTVDLVPASLADDDALNSANNANCAIVADAVGRNPLMLLTANADNPLKVGCKDLKSATPIPPLDLGMNVECIDPRWNWAPEHWFKAGQKVDKDRWLSDAKGFLGADGRDADIFLATSDSCYLQSVYELAFLPRYTDLRNYGNNQVYGNMTPLNGTMTDFAASPADARNAHLMWRTYHPYQTSAYDRDPFEDLRLVNEGAGFRINPYAQDENVMMAAFANTPFDWWAASLTTADSLAAGKGLMPYIPGNDKQDAKKFNEYYAFNEFNSDAKFKWKDLQGVAQNFINLVRTYTDKKGASATTDSWMDVFDGVEYSGRPTGSDKDPAQMSFVRKLDLNERMDWDGENNDFCGVAFTGTSPLMDVDRKFLYGYWRECFAAKQQLFLVFVRAEPMMMGGGASGKTPPQLGARAVALVWRDPTKSRDENTPHKTRVLFYRQFD